MVDSTTHDADGVICYFIRAMIGAFLVFLCADVGPAVNLSRVNEGSSHVPP